MKIRALPRVVSAAALAVAGAISLCSLSAATSANALTTKAPHCRASQIRETLQPIKLAKNAIESYEAWVSFTNTGALCNMSVVYVSLEALSGSTALAYSVVTTNLVSGNIVLRAGQAARTEIGVGRTNDPALGKSCKPKAANTFEVLPVYNGWPKKSFRLSSTVLVCTGSSDNLGGGWLLKTS